MIPEGIVTTAWPRVVAQCAEMGVSFEGWQDGAGSIILGKRADGKYAATVGGVVLSIPRQVGKTFLVGMIVIALCVLNPGLTVLWTAHRTRTTTKTFGSLKGMTSRKKIAPFMLEPRNTNGEQEIRFKNGSVVMFGAREQGFGRGFDEVDIEVFDEGQILTEKALEDMVAATNQSRQESGALLFFMGTPPRQGDNGDEFANRRNKALSGKARNMVYVEFSADRDADLDDQAQWAKANPSFPHFTPVESMERMRENLTDEDSFRREALGIWDEIKVQSEVIPAEVWSALVSMDPPAGDEAPSALGVDMSHGRTVAIAACWRGESVSHVELLAQQPADVFEAVEWIVTAAGRRIPVVIDGVSPAASMIPTLKARKVRVVTTTAADMAKACGGFYDSAMAGRLTHVGQGPLDEAVAGATKRAIRDAGGWAWDRKNGEVNIAPLVGSTLALFGAESFAKPFRSEQASSRRAVVL